VWLRPTNVALIRVNVESPAAGVQLQVAARGGVAAVEPPPDEADVPNIQNGEPTSVEAFLDTGAGTNEEASADFAAERPARCQVSPRFPPFCSTAHSSHAFVTAASAGRCAGART